MAGSYLYLSLLQHGLAGTAVDSDFVVCFGGVYIGQVETGILLMLMVDS